MRGLLALLAGHAHLIGEWQIKPGQELALADAFFRRPGGVGGFTRHIKTGNIGPALQITYNATTSVMRSGHNRNRSLRQIKSKLFTSFVIMREVAFYKLRSTM